MRWRVAGLLLAMLIIVGMPYVVTRENTQATQSANAWVTHSTAVRSLIYRIAYIARDSEAAAYRLLAGDVNATTQARAIRAADEVPDLLRQLRAMTRDNPRQQTKIGALENSVSGRLTLMAQARRQLQQGNAAGARESLREAGDLFPVNVAIDAIVHNESELLAIREKAAAARAFNGRLVLAITALAQLLLLMIIVVASERQIGRRRKAEDREGRAVQRSRLIFQAVREPIALFDANLHSLLVNNAFSELYGEELQQRSQPLAAIGGGVWNDTALLQRLKDVLLRDRELWDYDAVQQTADGQERHVVVNARRLQRESESDEPALLLTASDVTVRALTEQKVTELNRQLEGKVAQISDINRELEAFSYSVSHDLRAPLRHIAGFVRKLEQHLGEQVDDKAAHYIAVIDSSAQRMAQLIDDLLVFSRLGRGPLRLQAVDMQSLAEEARALAESGQVGRRIVWTIEALPMVIGDANMLRTVWQNLLGNAVKYTGKCEVARIEVSAQQGRQGDYEFTVADNGAGFDMQYADKLFGVFQRLHRASEFPGNGIGLANVRRIVTRHGGRVWAEAEPGQGARFHFSLPAIDVAGARNGESAI
ncbi:MAG: PAS domain S-box protein [Rhodanobacter sp.]|nr:MAG: PAS domain S-box protein [Rhodanobacter sp.]TAM41482.1 MAG: PAS domain S-box protein [Rhodanobacter sp.]TAN29424.1 MAG: PAS domain S-box protein [Rhodanobacter sp.]